LTLKRWEDFPKWISRIQKTVNGTNAKIIEALQLYGPRNIKSLSKAIKVPDTTIRFRIEKMKKQHLLLTTAHLDLTKLGLIRGFLVAESPLRRQELTRQTIKLTDYWNYIVRCYGKFDGFMAYFAFPARYKKELLAYLQEAAKLKVFSSYLFFWTTNTCSYFPCFEWYDFKEKQWKFRWEEWAEEILNSSERLQENLKEPENYSVLVDKSDLLILKELEKDATQDFRKIAKVVGITPQSVHYRWHDHIIKRKLILRYITSFQPYPIQMSDYYIFIIEFENRKSLAKFSNSLNKKPFITSYAKIIGKNGLIVGIYIPKIEFPNMIKTLNSPYLKGIVKNFSYVMLDIMSHERQTVSYEFFKDGEWSYDHERKLKELRKVIKTTSNYM